MKRLLPFLSVVLASACGTAAGPDYAPPLLTINGTIVSSSVATPATVRVALVWKAPTSLVTVQELSIRAEFPATFHFDVRTLPPPEAMHPLNPQHIPGLPPGYAGDYAVGTLIVYEDTNGNGRLDPIPVGGHDAVDRVLGAPERLEIVYLEGGGIPKDPAALPIDNGFLAHQAGFNLDFEPRRWVSDQVACTDPSCMWSQETSLTIALTADTHLASALCQSGAGNSAVGSTACAPCIGAACAQCLGPDAAINCRPDRSFDGTWCEATALCSDRVCHFFSGKLAPMSAVPAGWPCP
jgi:hypothetical protein